MKFFLRKIFSSILNRFEQGEDEFNYKPSHRTVLVIMGFIFFIVAGVALYFGMKTEQMAALFPTILFAMIGILCWIVGFLGNDRAVSNIWRTTR